jgi:Secretion system C-terminal sorting domain
MGYIIVSQAWTIYKTIYNPGDTFNNIIRLNTFNPVYNFKDTGSYWICLTLTTNTGCTRSYCNNVYVNSVNGKEAGRITSYPNPAVNQVKLILEMNSSSTIYLQVRNLFGNMVLSTKRTGIRGNNQITIPVQQLITGQYFIDIQFGNERKRSIFQKL